MKLGQSSHKMYSNNIVIFQASMTILNACTKKTGNLLKAVRIYICMYSRMSGYTQGCILTIDMYVRTEGKTEEKYLVDGLFIFLRVLTSIFWMDAKIFFSKLFFFDSTGRLPQGM